MSISQGTVVLALFAGPLPAHTKFTYETQVFSGSRRSYINLLRVGRGPGNEATVVPCI